MNRALTITAPAKINLSLRVLRRRDDGFHQIETLMCPLALADEITLAVSSDEGIDFTCDDPTLPTGGENLACRAAALFFRHTGLALRLRLELKKNIPHGAGLGGGSSDAASVLLGLDELLDTRLGTAVLAQLAAELGSDVPFFIYRSAAWCRGRGEQVEPVPLPAALPVLLLKPPFGVPTPWAYSRWRDSREVPGVRYDAQVFPWGTLVNDLERPVFEKYFFLAALKNWLLDQPDVIGALMSGSGSTVFALPSDESAGAALATRVSDVFGADMWTCVTRLPRSISLTGSKTSPGRPKVRPRRQPGIYTPARSSSDRTTLSASKNSRAISNAARRCFA